MDTPKLQPITNKLKNKAANVNNVSKEGGGDAAGASHAGVSCFSTNNSGVGYGASGSTNGAPNNQFSSADRRYNYKGPGRRDYIADRRTDKYQNRPESYRPYGQRPESTYFYPPHWQKNRYKNTGNRSNYHWTNYWQNDTLGRNTSYNSYAAEPKSMNSPKPVNATGIGNENNAETTTIENNEVTVNATTVQANTETGKKNTAKTNSTQVNKAVQPKKPKTTATAINKKQPKTKAVITKKIIQNKPKISANIIKKKRLTKTSGDTNKVLSKSNLKKFNNQFVKEKISNSTAKTVEQSVTANNLDNKEKSTALDNKEQSENIIVHTAEGNNRETSKNISSNHTTNNGEYIEGHNEESPTAEGTRTNNDFEEATAKDKNSKANEKPKTLTNNIASEEVNLDTEIILNLSQTSNEEFLTGNDDANIANIHTIKCVNITHNEQDIAILVTTDLSVVPTTDIPEIVDITENYTDNFEERESIEEEEEEIVSGQNSRITSPIKEPDNHRPRISIVPLSRLIRNELIENARETNDSNITENEIAETTIAPPTATTSTPSKRICRPNLVKRRRKISTCSNSSGTTENLIEKVAGMDKFGIKEVINNSGTRFDEALKVHARKRLREEIRKQLKSMNLETAKHVDNIDFVPDEIVDAICIPDLVLDEIRKAFGIEFFYNNDLKLLEDGKKKAGITEATAEDTAREGKEERAGDVIKIVDVRTVRNETQPLQESLVETTTTTMIVPSTETQVERENNASEREKTVDVETESTAKNTTAVLRNDKTKNVQENNKTLVNKNGVKTKNIADKSASQEKQKVTKNNGKNAEVLNAKNTKKVTEKDKTVEGKDEANKNNKSTEVVDGNKTKNVVEKEKPDSTKKSDKLADVKNAKETKQANDSKQKKTTKSDKTAKIVVVKKTKNVAKNKKEETQQQQAKQSEESAANKKKDVEEKSNPQEKPQQRKESEKTTADKAKHVEEKDNKREEQQQQAKQTKQTSEVVEKTKTIATNNKTLTNQEQTKHIEDTPIEVYNKAISAKITQTTKLNAESDKQNIIYNLIEDCKHNIVANIIENMREKSTADDEENTFMKRKKSKKSKRKLTKKSKRRRIDDDDDVILLDTSSSSCNSSSSSSSSSSTDSSTDTESEKSVRSVSSSVKRRRIKLRIDAQNIVESFEKLILPSLSDNLKTRYHNKFSNSTYTRLHFISCICTSEYNTKKFTKNEIAKIQADLKSEDRSAALEFLMREIVNVFNKQKENAKRERGSGGDSSNNRIRRNTDSTDKSQQSNDEATTNVRRRDETASNHTLDAGDKVNGICSETVKDASKKSADATENGVQSTSSRDSTPTKQQQQQQQHQSENPLVVEVEEWEQAREKNANNAKNSTTNAITHEARNVNAFAEVYEYLQQQHNNANQITSNRNMLVNELTRQHLANTSTSNNIGNVMTQRDETSSSSAANAARTHLNGFGMGVSETLPFNRLYAAENKLNGPRTSPQLRTENGPTWNNLLGLSPLMLSNTLFPNVDLDALRQKNILGEFVVNNLREMDFKLIELHKRKMFIEEMILKLQKDKIEVDMQTMQLQNEKFLLLNTAMTAAGSELPQHETKTATQTPPAANRTTLANTTPVGTPTPPPATNPEPPKTPTEANNTRTSTATQSTQRPFENLRKRKMKDNNFTQTKRYRARGRRGGCCRKVMLKRANNAPCKDPEVAFEPQDRRRSSSPTTRNRDSHYRTPSPHISSSDRWFNDADRPFNSCDIPVGTVDVKSPLRQVNLYEHYIIAGGDDGRLYKFNAKTLKLEMQFAKHSEAITHSYLCRDKKVLYTTSLDGYMKKTSLENFALDIQSVYMQEPLQCIEVQWGAAFIGSRWGNIFTYDIGSSNLKNSANSASDTPITAIKATKEGPRKILIVASKSKDLQIRDASTYLLLRTIALPDCLSSYTLLLDDGCIYCATQRRDIIKIDFITGELLCTLVSGMGASVVRQYQKKYLLVGSYDGCVYVIDKAKGRQWGRYVDSDENILTLTVIDNKIITTSKDKTLRINELPHYFEAKRK